jgi:hypothetical protein
MLETVITPNKNYIQLEKIPNGLYFLLLEKDNRIDQFKIIKLKN